MSATPPSRTRVTVTALGLLIGAVGCSSTAPADDGGADAEAPSGCDQRYEECTFGLHHAVCGGAPAEGPVLACAARCYWFTGGCPVGFVASRCPTDDACCHTTEDGPWPFETWRPADGRPSAEVPRDLMAITRAPIDDTTPSILEVSIDPAVAAPPADAASVRCSVGNLLHVCRNDGAASTVDPPRQLARSMTVRSQEARVRHGQAVTLEVVDASPGPVGRVFAHDFTDSAVPPPPLTCLPPTPRFTGGTLTISALDATAHGRLHAELEDGHWVELDF